MSTVRQSLCICTRYPATGTCKQCRIYICSISTAAVPGICYVLCLVVVCGGVSCNLTCRTQLDIITLLRSIILNLLIVIHLFSSCAYHTGWEHLLLSDHTHLKQNCCFVWSNLFTYILVGTIFARYGGHHQIISTPIPEKQKTAFWGAAAR